MRILLILLIVALIAASIYLIVSARRAERRERWRVVTEPAADGTLEVAVTRGGQGRRVVRRLPADAEGVDLTSDLRLAREEAEALADELNRRD